jgi:hypothetical protein
MHHLAVLEMDFQRHRNGFDGQQKQILQVLSVTTQGELRESLRATNQKVLVPSLDHCRHRG